MTKVENFTIFLLVIGNLSRRFDTLNSLTQRWKDRRAIHLWIGKSHLLREDVYAHKPEKKKTSNIEQEIEK